MFCTIIRADFTEMAGMVLSRFVKAAFIHGIMDALKGLERVLRLTSSFMCLYPERHPASILLPDKRPPEDAAGER